MTCSGVPFRTRRTRSARWPAELLDLGEQRARVLEGALLAGGRPHGWGKALPNPLPMTFAWDSEYAQLHWWRMVGELAAKIAPERTDLSTLRREALCSSRRLHGRKQSAPQRTYRHERPTRLGTANQSAASLVHHYDPSFITTIQRRPELPGYTAGSAR